MLLLVFSLLFITAMSSKIPDDIVFDETTILDKAVFDNRLQNLHAAADTSNSLSEVRHIFLFKEFTDLFQRKYTEPEFSQRFKLFQESLERHRVLNENEKRWNGTATYGINKFADWTAEEFESLLGSTKLDVSSRSNQICKNISIVDGNLYTAGPCDIYRTNPNKTDWRGKITDIKDQKNCGSCWAFVGSEQVESYWAIGGNPLVESSPQELLSCSPYMGCDGGNTCSALRWLVNTNRVLVSEKEYPYEGRDSKCRYYNMTDVGAKIKHVCGCRRVAGHEEIMLYAMSQKGPLGVNVDAVLWRDYIGGIVQHHCTNHKMNHAVQLVAYYLNDGPVPYWVARNQWGRSFGEDGFIRIKYGTNVCGVAEEPSFVAL